MAPTQPAALAAACFLAKVLAVWVFLVWERIGIARGIGAASPIEPRRRRTITLP